MPQTPTKRLFHDVSDQQHEFPEHSKMHSWVNSPSSSVVSSSSHRQQRRTEPSSSGQGQSAHAGGLTPTQGAYSAAASAAAQWQSLQATIKGSSQAAAALLMKQAASSAQVDDFVTNLLHELQSKDDQRAMLEAQLKRDRTEFTSQARQLSQHFATAQHKSMALQVVHEALQNELRTVKEALETSQAQGESLTQQLQQAQTQADQSQALLTELRQELATRDTQLSEQKQQNEEQRVMVKELRAAKSALQSQLSQMVAAERELTQHLKETHQQIQEQLAALQTQLQSERQRRVAVSRRKAELQHQNTVLAARVASLEERLRSGDAHAGTTPVHSTVQEPFEAMQKRNQQLRRQRQLLAASAVRSSASKPMIRIAATVRQSAARTMTPPHPQTILRAATQSTAYTPLSATQATSSHTQDVTPSQSYTTAQRAPTSVPQSQQQQQQQQGQLRAVGADSAATPAAAAAATAAAARRRLSTTLSGGAERRPSQPSTAVPSPAPSVSGASATPSAAAPSRSQFSLRSGGSQAGSVARRGPAANPTGFNTSTPTSRLTVLRPSPTPDTTPQQTTSTTQHAGLTNTVHGEDASVLLGHTGAVGLVPPVPVNLGQLGVGPGLNVQAAQQHTVATFSVAQPLVLPTAASQLGASEYAASGMSTPLSDVMRSVPGMAGGGGSSAGSAAPRSADARDAVGAAAAADAAQAHTDTLQGAPTVIPAASLSALASFLGQSQLWPLTPTSQGWSSAASSAHAGVAMNTTSTPQQDGAESVYAASQHSDTGVSPAQARAWQQFADLQASVRLLQQQAGVAAQPECGAQGEKGVSKMPVASGSAGEAVPMSGQSAASDVQPERDQLQIERLMLGLKLLQEQMDVGAITGQAARVQ